MTDALLGRVTSAVGTQYLVDAEIGRGGMAVVYRATDVRLHRRVAVKVLPPELAFNADVRERFLREAQTSAQLAHPGIVPIYTVGEADGLVYFVMALVDGESLAQRLLRDVRLPADDTQTILVAVADALGYAHAQGVVHRDVKPDNIMLDRVTGRALVTDFGIARAAAGDSRLTLTGVAIGTPAYMSPEQAIGERELDGRSDIYALGVIGYQMLAGETPFRASNTPAMLVKHVSEPLRPLRALRPDVPATLDHAITRALAKKPDDRWPDAFAFRDALAAPFDGPADTSSRASSARATSAFPWQHRAAPPARESLAATPPFLPLPLPLPLSLPARPGEAYPRTPDMPPMPAMPTWGTRADWRTWRRAQKDWERERARRERDPARDAARPVAERISRLHRKAIGAAGTVVTTMAINVATSPHFLWFLIPSAFATIGVLSSAAHLWSDGVPLSRMLSRGDARDDAVLDHGPATESARLGEAARALAPAEVLGGAFGEMVRRAASDQLAAREILAMLAPSERGLISDVGPTVDALAVRVGSLAITLHRLDMDVGRTSVDALGERLAALRQEAGDIPTSEQERRIALLERQRASIAELGGRRGALAAQIESASLALQNLRLDLLKLRSSGFAGALSSDADATREARALSRDIANAVEAMREADRL